MQIVIEIEDVMYALVMSQEPKEKEYWLYHVKHGKPLDSVLDKIRAEIESQREEVSNKDSENNELTNYYFGLNDGLKDARDIIDKYRVESEGTDDSRRAD